MITTAQELEQDFERLTETSMLWQAKDWLKQEGRFDGSVAFHHRVIYFFERYVDLMAAKAILKQMDQDYSVLYDNALDQWVITSTYATESWR
jgi:hypothetical protein